MLSHDNRRTLLLSDVGEQAFTPFDCFDVHVPTLTIDDDCPPFPNPIPVANRSRPGVDLCARPTDNDGTGHQEDHFFELGSYAADADPLWATFHDRDPSGSWGLYVVDDASDDGGSIGSWSVDITTTDRPPTAGHTIIDVHKGVEAQVPLTGAGGNCERTYVAGPTSGLDAFTYVVTDGFGGRTTGTIQVVVTATEPTAHARAVTAAKGAGTPITLTGSDPNGRPLACEVDATTAHGRATLTGTGCDRTITPKPGTSGTDTFTYVVRNDTGHVSARATVTITIPNRAPTAPTVAVAVNVGDSAAIALAGTDPDPGEGVALTCTPALGRTTRGTVGGAGCFVTYTAGATAGTDSFAYTVRDRDGATATGTVQVTIAGTAPPGCTPADGATARYVCRAYRDLLGRTADAAGKDYWVRRLTAGEHRAATVKAFTGTSELRSSVVRDVHRALLGTAPDAATVTRWSAELARGANPDLVRQEVLASDAFWARAGATPEGWVEAVHQQVLRRPATAAEVTTLAGQLRAGTTRATLAGRLLAATDADTATVAAVYERFLRRTPPAGETAYWVGRLQGGESEMALLRLIVASPEYATRA